MSYLVFARKYRPQTFENVIAQEHVTRTLQNAIKNDRVASGYLFCGPRGTGKTTIARILAKSINCTNGPTPTPCGKCPTCKEIAAGSSLDVLEIDAASNTGVDDIRTLRENVRYLPTSGKKRVYIIDEVHRLSGSAFDALLKTLEEPPEHVIFVFATTEPLKVPQTILSRTQRFDFRRVSTDDLADHLRVIAQKEKLTIDDAAINLLARKADGSVRDSLSLLDQIAAFATGEIAEQDVVNALGLVDRHFLIELVEAVAAADHLKVLYLVKGLFDSGTEVKDFVVELLDHLRTLMILSSDPDAGELLHLNRADLNEYLKQVEYFSLGDILRLMKMVGDLNADLRSGLDERLLLETTVVKMTQMESTIRFEDILAQMNASGTSTNQDTSGSTTAAHSNKPDIFGGAGQGNGKSPTKAGISKQQPAETERRIYTRAVNLPQIRTDWDNLLTFLRGQSPMLASQLGMAELRSVKDNQLFLYFAPSEEASLQLVTKPENMSIIRRTLNEHFRANLNVKFEIDQQNQNHRNNEPVGDELDIDPRQLLEQSSRLKNLVEKVDGEIIGIKKTDNK